MGPPQGTAARGLERAHGGSRAHPKSRQTELSPALSEPKDPSSPAPFLGFILENGIFEWGPPKVRCDRIHSSNGSCMQHRHQEDIVPSQVSAETWLQQSHFELYREAMSTNKVLLKAQWPTKSPLSGGRPSSWPSRLDAVPQKATLGTSRSNYSSPSRPVCQSTAVGSERCAQTAAVRRGGTAGGFATHPGDPPAPPPGRHHALTTGCKFGLSIKTRAIKF